MAESGRVRIHVIDATEAVITGAQVSLLGKDDKPRRSLQTNERGDAIFTDLLKGNLQFLVSGAGYDDLPLMVTVRSAVEMRVDAKLGVTVMGIFRPKRQWWQIFR